MNTRQKEVLKTIINDVQTPKIDITEGNNYYYYSLIIGNLKDLLGGRDEK